MTTLCRRYSAESDARTAVGRLPAALHAGRVLVLVTGAGRAAKAALDAVAA